MHTTARFYLLAMLAATLACGFAHAADAPATGKTTQQTRMKTCNADAKTQGLKGPQRKSFMSKCLRGQ